MSSCISRARSLEWLLWRISTSSTYTLLLITLLVVFTWEFSGRFEHGCNFEICNDVINNQEWETGISIHMSFPRYHLMSDYISHQLTGPWWQTDKDYWLIQSGVSKTKFDKDSKMHVQLNLNWLILLSTFVPYFGHTIFVFKIHAI